MLGAQGDAPGLRGFEQLGERRADLFVVLLDQCLLTGGGEVLLDGDLAGVAIAGPQPRAGQIVLLSDAPFVHQVEARFVPAHPGEHEGLEQREGMGDRADVGVGLDHDPVEQPEGQLDPLREVPLAVDEHGEPLGLRSHLVGDDVEHVVEVVLQQALRLPSTCRCRARHG